MLAVVSLAAISRFCRAVASAAPSFSAVARGTPSIGAIVTLALSRNVSIGEPGGGTSPAKGCGSGWQADRARIAAASDRGATGLLREGYRREAAPVSAFAVQTGAPVAEEPVLFSDRIMICDLDLDDARTGETVREVARKVEQKMALAARQGEPATAARVVGEERLAELRPYLV